MHRSVCIVVLHGEVSYVRPPTDVGFRWLLCIRPIVLGVNDRACDKRKTDSGAEHVMVSVAGCIFHENEILLPHPYPALAILQTGNTDNKKFPLILLILSNCSQNFLPPRHALLLLI